MKNYELNMQKDQSSTKDMKDFSLIFSEKSFDVLNDFISYSAVSAALPFPPIDEFKKKNIYDRKVVS